MRENQGFLITDSVQIGNAEFVAGESATVQDSFVTWECRKGPEREHER